MIAGRLAEPVGYPVGEEPAQLALADLRFIRSTMESAGSFTSIPGTATIVQGVTALVAAGVASAQSTTDRWLTVWMIEATFAAVTGLWAVSRRSRRQGLALTAGPNRRFVAGFVPAIVSGALLTVVLWAHGVPELLPGTWLLAFGTAVAAGGANSVTPVRFLGIAFMVLGGIAFAASPSWGNLLLALGFGGFLIAFGAHIVRRHGE